MPVKKKIVPKPPKEIIKYNCLMCGEEKKDTDFFLSKWSKVWKTSGQRVLFCKDCLSKIESELTSRYGEELSIAMMCHYIDVPFHSTLYRSGIEANSSFNIGFYTRYLSLGQYQYSSFINTLASNELDKTEREKKEETEAKWSKSDRRNREFAIATIGYDPFENLNMTQNDRRYCFNVLAGYCDIEGIKEDGHKLQSVVQISQMQLQCKKLDEFINEELLSVQPDDSKIKTLTATKKQLLDSVSKLAQDNNIASNYNEASSQGKNTLSQKMKEIATDGYEQIKVNMFDIRTCEAMRQIEDLSNKSILEQIGLDANDYTDMIKQQREMIQEYESKNMELQEENRNLKNRILDFEQKKK